MAARRAKDRKAQIARASAEAFSALGYHGVTMGTIASRVGISVPALYRHYPGKYALFRDAVLNLSQQLVDATEFADGDGGGGGDDPDAALRSLVATLIHTALTNRHSGGLYRWQAGYLRADDQATLDHQIHAVHHRIQRPLRQLRPDLTSRQCWTLSTAVLSVTGSVVDHRAKLPAARIKAVLAELAAAVVTADLTGVRESTGTSVARRHCRSTSTYDALLDEAMRQFNEKGYRNASVDDIAAMVGLPASGVYRHFSRKSDLLVAAFRRAADWLAAELTTIAATAPTTDAALTTAIDSYVARSFARPEYDYVYCAERLNLPAAEQNALRSVERAVVEAWTHLVLAVRQDLTTGEARFVVHAAMALVIDVGRLTDYQNSAETRGMVVGLMDLALLGRYRLRIALPAR